MEELPVVVVGAGVSGLCAVKACLEEELQPVICYESSDGFGGIWQFKETGMSVSDGTLLNSSKEWSCFSDFPAPPHFPNYMSHRTYLRYLRTFVDHFGIEKHLRFNVQVLKIKKGLNHDVDGRWRVTIQHKDDSSEEIEARAVIVCAGLYREQKIPFIPGLWDEFEGRVVLSKDYKRPDSFRHQKVVIIGSGNTAFDAAVELGKVADKVYLSLTHNGVLASRLDFRGYPLDHMYTRIWAIALNLLLRLNLLNFKPIRHFLKTVSAPGYGKLYDLQAGDNFFTSPIVINDEIPYRLASGQVTLKHTALRFTSTSIIFQHEEGREYHVDAVLVAAGFLQAAQPLFDERVLSSNQLVNGCYQQVFPVHLSQPRRTLALVGNIKANGAAAPMIEMQARWVGRVLSGKARSPSDQRVRSHLDRLRAFKKKFQIPSANLHTLGFYPYVDDVADEIDAKPNLSRLFFTDVRLWLHLLFEQFLPAQFRLVGPHARRIVLTYKQRLSAPFKTRPKLPTHPTLSHKTFNFKISMIVIFIIILFTFISFI